MCGAAPPGAAPHVFALPSAKLVRSSLAADRPRARAGLLQQRRSALVLLGLRRLRRIALAPHCPPSRSGELVFAAVLPVGRDGGRIAARLALGDPGQQLGRRLGLGRLLRGEAERGGGLRPDDAVGVEAVLALEALDGAPGLRPVDAVGLQAERASGRRRRRRPARRSWPRRSPPPRRSRRRRRRASARARPPRAAGGGAADLGMGRTGTDQLSARMNLAGHHAYGVSCRARALTCATPRSGGDSPQEPQAPLGPPLPAAPGVRDSAGSTSGRRAYDPRGRNASRRSGQAANNAVGSRCGASPRSAGGSSPPSAAANAAAWPAARSSG